MVWAMQNLAGNSFTGYSTYFLEQAGLAPAKSYDFALGQYGINCAGVFGAWFLMSRGSASFLSSSFFLLRKCETWC
jgi:SP family general alpha glucoside:H+ symporter-like MFS transporter